MRYIFTVFILGISRLLAQHPVFYAMNQAYLSSNPAFAGSSGGVRFQGAVALQNPGTNYANLAWYTGADVSLNRIHSGIGLSYQVLDYQQSLRRSQIDFSYAFKIHKGIFTFVPAVQLSYFDIQLNKYGTSYGDMIDPRRGFIWNTNEIGPSADKQNISISPGILIYTHGFFFGASLLDANRPDEGLQGPSARPVTQIYQAAYRLLIGAERTYRLDTYIKTTFQNPKNNMYQCGLYLTGFDLWTIQASYRYNDAWIAGVGLNKKRIKAGYNIGYHYRKSDPAAYSHELYLSVSWLSTKQKASPFHEPGF